jgi:Svf1-like N-terminal lipocalin domain
MWKWAQGAYFPEDVSVNDRIASVAGTAEPIYGEEAFQSVIARTKDQNPVSELSPEDYKWILPEQSHVETSTFYITAETGHAVMCQIIHSKVKSFPCQAGLTG